MSLFSIEKCYLGEFAVFLMYSRVLITRGDRDRNYRGYSKLADIRNSRIFETRGYSKLAVIRNSRIFEIRG